MKGYTDINQSKLLAEILPLESADMLHCLSFDGELLFTGVKAYTGTFKLIPELSVPCWSLSALMSQMPCVEMTSSDDGYYRVFLDSKFSNWHNNLVDACVELLERVKEEKQ